MFVVDGRAAAPGARRRGPAPVSSTSVRSSPLRRRAELAWNPWRSAGLRHQRALLRLLHGARVRSGSSPSPNTGARHRPRHRPTRHGASGVDGPARPAGQNHNGGSSGSVQTGICMSGRATAAAPVIRRPTAEFNVQQPPVVESVNQSPVLGKLLRIDPRVESPYAIPAGNTFPAPAGRCSPTGCGTLAVLLRPRHRGSGDRRRRPGQLRRSSMRRGRRGSGWGASCGWGVYEGSICIRAAHWLGRRFRAHSSFRCSRTTHGGDGFCAIGRRLYGPRPGSCPNSTASTCMETYAIRLRAVALTPGGAPGIALGLAVDGLASFGEDGCGRVYAVSLNGPMYRPRRHGRLCGAIDPLRHAGRLHRSDATVNEGERARLTTSPFRRQRVHGDVHGYATADGTATAPGNYTSTSGTLSFAPGKRARRSPSRWPATRSTSPTRPSLWISRTRSTRRSPTAGAWARSSTTTSRRPLVRGRRSRSGACG